jgi:aminomethyltransferase
MDVLNEAGAKVGIIASGSFCPTIEKSVAFAYIKAEAATPGTKLQVATGRTNLPATIVPTPFYTGAKGRAKWETIA